MIKIQLFNLGIGKTVMRFFLMIAVALILGFAEQWYLMAFIAGPIGAMALMGVSFSLESPSSKKKSSKIIQFEEKEALKKAI